MRSSTQKLIGQFLLASFFIFTFTACDPPRPDAAAQLLGAFSASCPSSTGPWTEAAQNQGNRLIGVLEALKATDKCSGYESAISEVQDLTFKIEEMFTDNTFQAYRFNQTALQELNLTLSDLQATMDPINPDPNDVALEQALNAAIIDKQVNLAVSRADRSVSANFEDKNRHVTATRSLARRLQTLQYNIRGLSECLYQSPLAAVQVAGSLLALGGSYVNPIIGAGAAVAGQLLGIGIEYARQYDLNDAIWKSHAAQLPSALSCGLEAMSELYCQANDAYALVKLQTVSDTPQPQVETSQHMLTRGLDILGRRLRVLLTWLDEVRSGGEPSDQFDSARLVNKWNKLFKVHLIDIEVKGSINAAKKLHDREADDANKVARVIDAIKGIARRLGITQQTRDFGNPFTLFQSNVPLYACWLIRGMEGDCPTPEVGVSIDVYLRSVPGLINEVTLVKLRTNWREIYNVVNQRVTVEFAQNVTVDEASSLVSAFEQNEANNFTPYLVLKLIQGFFQDMKTHWDEDESLQDSNGHNPRLGGHLESTIELLGSIITILDNVDGGDGPDGSQLAQVINKLKLYVGTSFVEERVRKLIRWDIQHRVNKGEIPQNAAEIVMAAGGIIEDVLLASGSYDLEAVELDLNSARSMTETNLDVFRDHFSGLFDYAINFLRKQEIRGPVPERPLEHILNGTIFPGEDLVNRPNGQTLAKLCTLVLATGTQWPDGVTWEVCESAILGSIYSDSKGTNTLFLRELHEKSQGQKLMDRMCAFHRFMRESRLAESVQHANATLGPGRAFLDFIGRH